MYSLWLHSSTQCCEIVTTSWFFIMKNWCCWFMFDVSGDRRARISGGMKKVNHIFFNNTWKRWYSCVFIGVALFHIEILLYSPRTDLLHPSPRPLLLPSKHTILRAKNFFETNERMRTNESMTKFCGPEIGSDLCCGTFYGCRFRQ